MARITVKAATKAIRDNRGNVSAAADALGCSRRWLYDMADAHEAVAEAIRESRERILDKARDNLFTAVERGDRDTSKWLLARLDPSFRESASIDHDGKLVIEVVRHDDD